MNRMIKLKKNKWKNKLFKRKKNKLEKQDKRLNWKKEDKRSKNSFAYKIWNFYKKFKKCYWV